MTKETDIKPMSFLHWIEHRLGWITGRVVSKLDVDNNVWLGFQCTKCHRITNRFMANPPPGQVRSKRGPM